ncbi:MAG: winged helix-turn-helix domain-containing protein [Stagnimonas sp.]|nr:winged helix-turn-helix domain-containing protein [Stagnimonas sp.]
MDDRDTQPTAARDESGGLWTFAGAELNDRLLSLKVKGQPAELDYKSIEVLLVLLRHAGEVVTKDELLDTVWARAQGNISEGVLTNAISRLRKLLGDEVIVTQHRVGYRLTVPVTRKSLAEAASELHLKPGEPVPAREAWLLLRPVGTGGQGEVWLAEHRKTREQRVFKFAIDAARLTALKREATLYRLLREVLGERPDFARVLEWNFTAPPFFLECQYGGVSLSDWAAQDAALATLSPQERLRLLVEIVAAVAAAHSAGVLHKDLKPGNVLVYPGADDRLHPRLTDFGSSRLADPAQLDALGITRLGFTVTQFDTGSSQSGTPLYLAPELMAGQLPTVQSDVYALGVMLYQFVVGDFSKPLVAGWEQDVDDALLREDIAAAAHGSPARRLASAAILVERLQGLETRRAAQQREHTRQTELQAKDTRLRQLRLRRPWVLAFAAVLVVGLGSSLWLFQQSRTEARTAWAINEFLQNEVLGFDMENGEAKSITVLQAMQNGEQGLDQELAAEPEIRARVYATLARAYLNLGRWDEGEKRYSKVLAIYREMGKAPNQSVLEAMLITALSLRDDQPDHLRAKQRILKEVQPFLVGASGQNASLLSLLRAQLALKAGQPDVAARAARAALPYNARDGLFLLQRAQLDQGQGLEARDTLQRLFETMQKDQDWLTAEGISSRTFALSNQQRVDTGLHLLAPAEAVHADALRVLGLEHAVTIRAALLEAMVRLDNGQAAAAASAFAALYPQAVTLLGWQQTVPVMAADGWVKALQRSGRTAEAQARAVQVVADADGAGPEGAAWAEELRTEFGKMGLVLPPQRSSRSVSQTVRGEPGVTE